MLIRYKVSDHVVTAGLAEGHTPHIECLWHYDIILHDMVSHHQHVLAGVVTIALGVTRFGTLSALHFALASCAICSQ